MLLGKLLKKTLPIILIFISIMARSQNLVNNPGFENVNTGNLMCSWYLDMSEFNNAINNWTCPTDGTTDIFSTSLSNTCWCHPLNPASGPGTQAPRTGNSMSALFVYGDGGCDPWREYIQGSLSSAMVPGQEYCIEFYVSLGDNSQNGANNIGVYFTTSAWSSTNGGCPYAATPQVNYTAPIITDKTSWSLISMTFTPTQAYNYFTIGNFYNDAATATVNVGGSDSATCYYIDDVSIKLCVQPLDVSATGDTICNGETATLTASSNIAGTSFVWNTGANGNSISVTPNTTTTYTVVGTSPTGVVDSATATVVVNPLATATISGGANVCAGSTVPVTITIALTGTPPWNFTYNCGATATAVNNINTSPYTFTTTTPGVYTMGGGSDAHCPMTSNGAAVLNAYPLPVVSLAALPPVCISAPAFALTGGTPAGGTYSGPGVTANNFDPATAGAGTHNIVYTYTDLHGCTNKDTNTLTVNPLPSLTLPVFASACLSAPAYVLSGGTPTGGNYSGPGVLGNIFTPSTAGLGTHTITYTYTDANSCTNTATNTLTVNPAPTVTLAVLPDVCIDAAAFTLTGESPAGGTFSGTGVSGGSFDPATSGIGSFNVTYSYTDTASGCIASATQPQTVNPLPGLTISSFPDICASTPSFLLTGATPTGGTFSGNGIINNIFDPSVVGAGNHLITYTYTDPNTGCTQSIDTNLQVINNINISVSPNTTYVCEESSVTLSATGASSFSWSPSAGLTTTTGPTVIATPPTTITYTVTGSNANGCSGVAMTTVNLYPRVNQGFLTVPGNGCKPLEVNFLFSPGAEVEDSSWHWDFGDILALVDTSNELNPTHTYIEEGNYTATLTLHTVNGCIETATMPVNVYSKPIADFYWTPEVGNMIDPNITFVSSSVGANYFYWDFGDPATYNYNVSNDPNPVHAFSDSGVYEVQLIVEANQGCLDTISKYVTIYPETIIYIPNAFTPDKNGLNDTWGPGLTGVIEEGYALEIWDRWGKNIWSTNNLMERWDGRINDKLVPGGTYVWILKYREPSGKDYKMKGIVTVVR